MVKSKGGSEEEARKGGGIRRARTDLAKHCEEVRSAGGERSMDVSLGDDIKLYSIPMAVYRIVAIPRDYPLTTNHPSHSPPIRRTRTAPPFSLIYPKLSSNYNSTQLNLTPALARPP